MHNASTQVVAAGVLVVEDAVGVIIGCEALQSAALVLLVFQFCVTTRLGVMKMKAHADAAEIYVYK